MTDNNNVNSNEFVPVVTIDGPSGGGKGTISRILATNFGWHILDSGAIYRLLVMASDQAGIDPSDTIKICQLAKRFHQDIKFQVSRDSELPLVYYQGLDVSDQLRLELVGGQASKLAAIKSVRQQLLRAQRAFRKLPGLVADGRDMGTVVFPDALVKIFLTASVEERAKRRYKQLKQKGKGVSMPDLLRDISERDRRDATRGSAPMKAAPDAITLDTTVMTVAEVVAFISERKEDQLHGNSGD